MSRATTLEIKGRHVRSHAEAGMRENAYSRGIVFKLTRRFSRVSPRVTVMIFSLPFFLSFFRPLSRPNLGSRTNTPSPFKDRVTHSIPIRPPLIRVNYVFFKITGLEGRDAKRNHSRENESETILKEKRGRRERKKKEKRHDRLRERN